MRILLHSSDPDGTAAYSNQIRVIAKRLQEAGHTVRIGTKHPGIAWRTTRDGLEVFEATNTELINEMLEEENFDYIFTFWDTWILHDKVKFPCEKWVQWVPVDTEWISRSMADVAKESALVVAMSKHGERELKRIGLDPLYVPCAIDTETFKPNPDGRKRFRDDMGLTDENFVIGSVGLNYPDDRKGFIPLMRAFKVFHERHPEARLYLHTLANAKNHVADAINYLEIAKHIGIDHVTCWPHQPSYFMGRIDSAWLADCYNGMDLFCLPTRGEGFGVPIVEAQACGVPVVTTDTTTGPELVGPGWLIETDKLDDARWLPTGTDRLECRPSKILEVLEMLYINQDRDKDRERRTASIKNAAQYDWSRVWPEYWEPLLKTMAERLNNPKEEKC
jgi:glycosyltransferase involved in cell wall biosynthesis